jgi:hypothetical protein
MGRIGRRQGSGIPLQPSGTVPPPNRRLSVRLSDARFDVVELIGHETGAAASRHIDNVNRKSTTEKIVRPAFPPIRGGEKMHADQSAARHHDHRRGIFAVAQFMRDEIFDISLADQNLLLVVRDIFEVTGVLRPRLRAVDNPAAGPKNAMGFEHERRTLLIHRRIGISVGSRRKKISCQQ